MAVYSFNPAMTERSDFVLLGTGGLFTRQVIATLLQHREIPRVYLQYGPPPNSPDTAVGIKLQQPGMDLQLRLEEQGVVVRYAKGGDTQGMSVNTDAFYLLVACWPKLLPAEFIQSFPVALNLHPSLLPKFRGFNPIAAQLAAGDPEFGVTLHLLNERFDSGDIVLRSPLGGDSLATYADIERSAATRGAELFIEAMATYHTPGWRLVPQQVQVV